MSPQLSTAFRTHLPDLSQPRFTTMAKQDAHEYAADFKKGHNPPWLHALYMHWLGLLKEPMKGVTNDGTVREGIFPLEDQNVPIEAIVDAASKLLEVVSPAEMNALTLHVDAPEWRMWSNPEFLLANNGLRLDEVTSSIRSAVLKVVEESLSPEGYAKAVAAMRINGFLGELVGSPKVMNEFSYNFVLFGQPSVDRPWGWQLYGHHLCLNAFFYKRQVHVAPWFTGAEPNEIDEGPYKGTTILQREATLGLELMQSLDSTTQKKARIFEQMNDPKFPAGRWNRDDQRHLCGAYRDNRIVPYEGVVVSNFSEKLKEIVWDIVEEYMLYLPSSARRTQLARAKTFESETYFSWIGGFGDEDAFYYRIHNPFVVVEFDHHSGVFLTNTEPAKFHTHTLLRMPNGGDYGHALKRAIPSQEEPLFVWEPENPSNGAGNHASRVD